MALPQIIVEKRDEILIAAKQAGVTDLRVFGSMARNNSHPGSDIDLLYLPPAGFTLFDAFDLKDELQRILGIPVDLVSERGIRPRIKERIMRDATRL